jgi:hypothetical protein
MTVTSGSYTPPITPNIPQVPPQLPRHKQFVPPPPIPRKEVQLPIPSNPYAPKFQDPPIRVVNVPRMPAFTPSLACPTRTECENACLQKLRSVFDYKPSMKQLPEGFCAIAGHNPWTIFPDTTDFQIRTNSVVQIDVRTPGPWRLSFGGNSGGKEYKINPETTNPVRLIFSSTSDGPWAYSRQNGNDIFVTAGTRGRPMVLVRADETNPGIYIELVVTRWSL